jgi:hypothetical protein
VNNDNFKEEITLKFYLKYVYQPVLKGPKKIEKEAFIKTINGSLDSLYNKNL